MRKGNRKPKNKKVLIASAAVLLAAAVYLGGTAFFGSHFLPRTTVGGVDVSLKSAKSAEALLNEESPAIEVLQKEKETEKEVSEKILLADVAGEAIRLDVDSLLESQSGFGWPLALFRRSELGSGTVEGTLNDAKLLDAVRKLYCLQKGNVQKPKEASLDLKDGKISVTPAEDGCFIKEKTVLEKVKQGIEEYLSGKGTASVDLRDAYEKADAGAAEKLRKTAEELQPVLDKTITIEIPDAGTVALTGQELWSLLELSDDNTLEVNYDAAAEYIAAIGQANDVSTEEYLDRDALLAALTDALTEGSDQVITAEWIVEEDPEEPDEPEEPEEPAEEPDDGDDDSGEEPAAPSSEVEGELIEVHYNEQMLYYYQDGALVMSSPIVSGNEEQGIIPPGTYYVTFMAQGLTLTGSDYSDYVDYWIGFDNAAGEWNAGTLIGFHDASWRNGEFGGDIWRYDPSHGCINMPTDKVAFLYANVENGVEIHIMY